MLNTGGVTVPTPHPDWVPVDHVLADLQDPILVVLVAAACGTEHSYCSLLWIEIEFTGQRLVKSHIVARSMAITDWSVLGHKEIAQRIDWIHLQIVSYIQAVVLGNLCVKEIKILYGYPAWNPGATILIDLSCLNVWRWCMLNNKHYSL